MVYFVAVFDVAIAENVSVYRSEEIVFAAINNIFLSSSYSNIADDICAWKCQEASIPVADE